jgi:Predicted methyltransferase regulatory domain
MRTEARRLKRVPASYILGEFLAPDNTPCHVRDFIEQTANHRLDYLCEVDLFAAVPQTLDPAIRSRVTSFAGSSRSAMEQHIDFLTGRLFRRSVLVRQQQTAGPQRVPGPDRLTSLHVASPIRLDTAQTTDQVAAFKDDRDRPITTEEPVIREAFERLARAYPATLTLDELTASPAGAPPISAEAESRVRRAIFTLVLAGRRASPLCRCGWGTPIRSGQGRGTLPAPKRHRGSPGSPALATRARRRIQSFGPYCRILTEPMTARRCGRGWPMPSEAAWSGCRSCRPIRRSRRRSVLTPSQNNTSNRPCAISRGTRCSSRVWPDAIRRLIGSGSLSD